MLDKKILLSQEGLAELQEELQVLKTEKRQEIADKLKEAISFGDLSENAEYAAAREEQAHVETRIAELEEMLKELRMVSGDTYQSRNGYSDKVVAIDVGNSCYLHASHASPHHI